MNPETDNYTQERETNDTRFAETMQGGDKTRNQDSIGRNDTNRGPDQGQHQGGNRTNDIQSGNKEQRKDEGNKGTTGANR
jgi:hypothetical protein